ncbi:MAG: heavy-metal-associated domain-containing protein [Alphaproteobacteria bacterium]|jgi:copper chaperone|nr:heavy-metal-associated domain-containing protein [Alphaproteobacteria bacterium]MBT7943763.1 heavy-metal-associated domain-containing protein [Alphaproteobacteria bacterium]
MTKKYRVLGMTCGGCASSVTKAIQAAAPKASVEVDLDAKEVNVDGIADDTTVQNAVEGAGFEFGGPV